MTRQEIQEILCQRNLPDEVNAAYDKILDPSTREEGLRELESLRGLDEAVTYIIGEAHERNFDENKNNVNEAKKAISEYQKAMMQGHYDFLKDIIARIKKDAGL